MDMSARHVFIASAVLAALAVTLLNIGARALTAPQHAAGGQLGCCQNSGSFRP